MSCSHEQKISEKMPNKNLAGKKKNDFSPMGVTILKRFPVLKILHEEGCCDNSSIRALESLLGDRLISRILPDIQRQYSEAEEREHESEGERAFLYALGKKLSALEEYAGLGDRNREIISHWMDDPKRYFLFNASPQGDLYLDLLRAKAIGSARLNSFRREFNPYATPQGGAFSTGKITYHYKEGVSPSENLETRLIQLSKTLVKRTLEEEGFDEWKVACLGTLREVYANEFQNPEGYSLGDALSMVSGSLVFESYPEAKEVVDSFLFGGGSEIPLTELCLDDITLDIEMAHTKVEESLNSSVQSIMQQLITGELIDDNGYIDESAKDLLFKRFHVSGFELHEIEGMLRVFRDEGARHLSEKIKNEDILTYWMELSRKDPLDVRFGNDGGTCLGVYEKSDIGMAFGVPYILADNGTYIFNVNEQINQRKPKRVGMAIGFECCDDLGNKALLLNSIDLFPHMNPVGILKQLVGFLEGGFISFGEQRGFPWVLMGNTEYNTSFQYTTNPNPCPPQLTFEKAGRKKEMDFHCDVLQKEGDSYKATGKGLYVLRSPSKQSKH